MNTTVKSLQDLYVELGGSLTDTYEDIAGGVPVSDYTTNPDVVEAIAQIAGKSLELPKTTEADAGSVLMVNEDGNWDKGEVPTPEPELPEVTSADNGKVLGVVDGEWDATTPPSSGLEVKKEGINGNTDSAGYLDISSFPAIGYNDKIIIIGVKPYYLGGGALGEVANRSCIPYYSYNSVGTGQTKIRPTAIRVMTVTTNGEVPLANTNVSLDILYVEIP